MSCNCECTRQCPTPLKRGDGLFGTIFKLLLVYVAVVFLSGTLLNASHPVAVEVGKLLHLATFVDPAIHWAEAHDCRPIASALQTLSHGLPMSALMNS